MPRTLSCALFPSYKQRPCHMHSRQKKFNLEVNPRLSTPFKINPTLCQVKEIRLLDKFVDLVCVWGCFLFLFCFFLSSLSCDQLKNLRQNSKSYHSKTIESVNELGRKQASTMCFSLFCCINTFLFCSPLLPLSCTNK